MKNHIYLQALSQGIGTVISIGMLLFLSAGTVDYAGAWIFLGTISCCSVVFVLWLKFKHPKQFENRMYTKETDRNQRSIVRDIGCFLCCSLVLSGLDQRFSWSHIPEWRYTIAVALLLASATTYRNVFIVNPYLSNTVIIHRDHAVIQEGMYRICRGTDHVGYALTVPALLWICFAAHSQSQKRGNPAHGGMSSIQRLYGAG